MDAVAGDSLESYLSRYRLRLLMDEWLDVVAQRQPEDPFSYLVGLINGYNRDGCGLVTCENKWCEMVIPASEYAAHLATCSEVGKWVKCTRCNVRVEASRMRQHKRNCKLESCAYCGEMVVPRLRDMCPCKLKADAERACRKQAGVARRRDSMASPPPSPPVPSSAGAPPYLRRPLSFPSHLKDRLISIQNSWRRTFLQERFKDLCFKFVWQALELYREKQATKEYIAIPRDTSTTTSAQHFLNYAALMRGCISVSRFEALAKTITSGAVVEFATAERIISMAIGILAARPLVQRVTIPEGGDVVVIGDLHGQMKDLREAIVLTGGLPNPHRYLVFNGDFVDRGSNGMGVLLYVFTLLCAFPSFVFINRGNHEDTRVNAEYGFETEVYGKYGMEHAKRLLEVIVDSYQSMPLMTVLDGMILVAHGGVPRLPVTLERIESLGRMRDIPTAGTITDEEQIIVDILWNDPVEKFHSRQLGLRHRAQHWRTSKRGCGVEYLAPITEEFLRLNNLRLVVRSHEEVQAGFELVHNGQCCTVFSASNYCGVSGNRAALAVFPKGSLHPVFHTWYVRNDEVEIDAATTRELLHEIMAADGGKGESDGDEEDVGGGETAGKFSAAEKTANDAAGGGEVTHAAGGAAETEAEAGAGADATATYSSSVKGKLMSRLNVLMQLAEIIFRKRYTLLSGFVGADYEKTGIIYKIEWCEVMRSVLEIDLPWYYLCKFVAPQEELEEVPCVRYVSFLRRFEARFSSQYLLPFQVAIVRRVFGEMDLPDDLLGRLNGADASEATTASSLSHGQCQPVAAAGSKAGLFPPEAVRGMSRSKSSTLRSQDSDVAHSLRRSNAVEPWRLLKVDFNVFASVLRSLSHVAATLEDDAMYALFQYLDSEECGHVVLGGLVDLVEATLDDGEEIVLLGTSVMLDADFGILVRDNEKSAPPPTRGSEAAMTSFTSSAATSLKDSRGEPRRETDPAAPADAGQEKQTEAKPEGKLLLSSLVLSCTPGNADTAAINFGQELSSAVKRPSRTSVDENVADALWLYPALLRLHEGFNYGLLTSLQQNFRNLNRTKDGKLTFDQLNVALQLMGRHMREPLTNEQAKRIFNAIRTGGKRLTGLHPQDAFAATRSEMYSSASVTAAIEEPTTVQDSSEAPDVLYITMNEFVKFFSITSMGGSGLRRRSVDADSLKTTTTRGGETWAGFSATRRRNSNLETFLEELRTWPHAEVLDELTVGSFSSRFGSGKTLLRALQELMRASAASARLAAGVSPNRGPSLSHSVKRGTGFSCPPATSPSKLPASSRSKSTQQSTLKELQPTEEAGGPDDGNLPKTVVGALPRAGNATAAPSMATEPAPASAPGSAPASASAQGSVRALASASASAPAPGSASGDKAHPVAGAKVTWKRRTEEVHAASKPIPSKPSKASAPTAGSASGAQPRRALLTQPLPQRRLSRMRLSFQQSGAPKAPLGLVPSREGGGANAPSKTGNAPGLPTVRGTLPKTPTPPPARPEPTDASARRK
ncbi:serine/threonine protein phosphatase-like protein [Trypanosoma conorhini]|uniref:Serine/threonine-protein phosphatase n=1 Tax=Trypanosoma conorhini TaxID=83891 RepID=A0A3R7KRZ9_9TRYP|nr:serine/threonine protein phosphatase-like protein [Trypanosoma conorhini]RNF08520.1 serine/threonine protein phosphatase-like protein [Trypanosoma conorhini]